MSPVWRGKALRRLVGRRNGVRALLAAILVAVAALAWTLSSGLIESADPACRGQARCFSGGVTGVVDGDTLDIGGARIRLALVDTPEVGEAGYAEAKAFTADECPVGSTALVDEDDGQTEGSFGRIIARVFCGSTLLNAALVDAGHAVQASEFCAVSEFADEPWSGCP